MDAMGIYDSIAGISAELTQRLREEGRREFNEAHEAWLAEQEREANKYNWIQAKELVHGVTVCERATKGNKVYRYRVTKRLVPESKFDRHVKVQVDKSKVWRYEPEELVMVLA
jgi:hypothetical protein